MSNRDHMMQLAKKVMENAYSPYSKFKVGACIRTEDGQFFTGCNIENVSYSLTLCAEASAIANAVSLGPLKIAEVAIASSGERFCPPCGACRQRLAEFALPNTLVHMSNAQGEITSAELSALLPSSFSEKNMVS